MPAQWYREKGYTLRNVTTSISLTIIGVVVLCGYVCLFPHNGSAQTAQSQIGECLRHRIEAAGIPPELSIQGGFIHASMMLPLFYDRRSYQPAWCDSCGPLPQAEILIRAIGLAAQEGLRPEDYHLTKIEHTLETIRQSQGNEGQCDPDLLADLDLLLTQAFLTYGTHLLAGRIDPETIDPGWYSKHRERDLAHDLQQALESNRIEETLHDLVPRHLGYMRLRDQLTRYRRIAAQGGWPAIPDYPRMMKAEYDKHARSSRRRPTVTLGGFIRSLRTLLVLTGDLSPGFEDGRNVYDGNFEEAIRAFQARHGLEVNGCIDEPTLAAMNVPVDERIRQIELNMERFRWLPQDFGNRYVLINIAGYELNAVENNRTKITMRVVVGKPLRRTPVFSDKMTYLVFNPYWYVPPTIATEDLLPIIRKNPDFFAQKEIKVIKRQGPKTIEIDHTAIDWSSIDSIDNRFTLRQEPGPNNPLGRIKFIFPNKYDVYIHDTPSKGLFEKSERTFSSGCIRIEHPIELAEFVLSKDERWTRERINSIIEKGNEQTLVLPEPVPVHLFYWTAWVDGDGAVHFSNDVYERDKPLIEALKKSPADLDNSTRRWCYRIIIGPEEQPRFVDWPYSILEKGGVVPFLAGGSPLQG